MKMSQASKDVRLRMDAILALALVDKKLRKRLVKNPEQVLKAFAFSKTRALALAKAWGIGPHADCGGDTCRLTSPCGWTVCGKTTNSCVQIPNLDTIRINPVPLGKIKVKAKVR